MKTKLVHLLARLSLGKELATALTLLQLILDAVKTKNIQNVSLFVFRKMPAQWRHPEGPATETEFVEMVKAGETFIRKVQALATR